MQYFPLIVSFLSAVLFIVNFRKPAVRYGLVDIPRGRKQHEGHIPLIGGLAIFFGYGLGVLAADQSFSDYRSMFVGMCLLLVFGLLDDLKEISAKRKLILQLFVATMLVFWGGYKLTDLGNIFGFGEIGLGLAAIPFTVVCIVGFINAINMLDGVDGLAGGVTLTAILILVLVATLAGTTETVQMELLAAAIAGFLVVNFPIRRGRNAAVFLGDSGSMMLGFAVAAFAIEVALKGDVPPIVIASILVMPVFDAVILMVRRIMKGLSPFEPDREHLHHILERAGFEKKTSVYILIVWAVLPALIAIGLWQNGFPEWAVTLVLFLFLAVHVYVVFHAWKFARFVHAFFSWK